MSQQPLNLGSTFLRLRPDCSVERLAVDEQVWPRLMGGHLGDFHNEYLATSFCLQSGSATFVPRGTWHTSRTAKGATLPFITPGKGTQHRPAGGAA